MASSRLFVISAALALAAALSVVPAQATSAASTSVSVVLPSAGATLSGTQFFDAVPNGTGDTGVQFLLVNPPPPPRQPPSNCEFGQGLNGCLVGDATLTWVGWVVQFNTESVPNGTYLLGVNVQPGNVMTSIPVTISNPPPTIVLPTNNSTVSGNQTVFDCVPPPGMSAVSFWVGNPASPIGLQQVGGSASLTLFGWLYIGSLNLPNGTYQLVCGATYPEGGMGFGPPITITVAS